MNSEIDFDELETALYIHDILDSIIEGVFFRGKQQGLTLNRGRPFVNIDWHSGLRYDKSNVKFAVCVFALKAIDLLFQVNPLSRI